MNLEKFRKWQITGRTYQPLELEEMEPYTCPNCGQVYRGNFCPNCGQKAHARRLQFMGAVKEFLPLVYNFDVKFLRTCLELCTRPGHMIRDYIIGCKRCSYNNPVALIFILVTVYLVEQYLFFGSSAEESRHLFTGNMESVQSRLINHCGENMGGMLFNLYRFVDLVYQNMAITTLLSMLLYVLPNKIAFRKTELGSKLNLTEHFYIMVYIACIEFIISIVLLPYNFIQGEAPHEGHTTCSFLVMWFVFKQFYQIGIRRSFFRTLVCVVLMALLVIVIAVILVLLTLPMYGEFRGTQEFSF